MAGDLNLSNLKPAQARKDRKRVGRGLGSGKGRYSGRGIKGQKSRAGSHMMRAGFEGGQMPAYMRMGKQRGSTSKDAMPIGPFRTYVWNVNVRDLARFDAGTEVTPELLKEAGLIRNIRRDVKVLGHGDLSAEALGLRARLLEERGREDRGRRRQRHLAEAAARAEEAPPQEEGRARSAPEAGCGRRGGRRRRGRRSRRGRCRPRSRPRRPKRAKCSPGSPTRGGSPSSVAACSSRRWSSRSTGSGASSRRRASTRPDHELLLRQGGTVLGLLNLFSGNALSRFSIFALGIMPYITASIILQLMAVVVPTLAQLQKEGEAGYAKINQYTRYLTIVPRCRAGARLLVPLPARRACSARTPAASC